MIPHQFHFVFGLREQSEPFHLMYYLCLASCIEINQPDAVHFHYHHEPHGEWWERIKPRLRLHRIEPEAWLADHRYSDRFMETFRYAHLADFARLRILLEHGGIYADIDTLFLRPIPGSWLARRCILGHELPAPDAPLGRSLCNAWIAAEPNSEFCRRWLEAMPGAFGGGWNHHSTFLPYALSRQYPDLLDVEPEASFYAVNYEPHSIDGLFLRSETVDPAAYSLHLWSHLWWNPARSDFSHFSHRELTPDYVAFANTTYAGLARRFLPGDVPVSRLAYAGQRWKLFRRSHGRRAS
jgi:hypothetical protein